MWALHQASCYMCCSFHNPYLVWAISVSLCHLSLGPALYFVLNFSSEWDLTIGVGFESTFRSWGPTMDCFCNQRWKAPPKKGDKNFVDGSGSISGKGGHSLYYWDFRFKGVNVTNVTRVWRKCKYIDHVAFAKSTKRIDALYDFSSQSPEERSIFTQISKCRQASHQGVKAQGHNAALDPCFAFSSSLFCIAAYIINIHIWIPIDWAIASFYIPCILGIFKPTEIVLVCLLKASFWLVVV